MADPKENPGFFGAVAGVLGRAGGSLGSMFGGMFGTRAGAPLAAPTAAAPKPAPSKVRGDAGRRAADEAMVKEMGDRLSGGDGSKPPAKPPAPPGGQEPSPQSPRPSGGLEGFLHHHEVYSGFKSSNVNAIRYEPNENYLEVGYKNGGWYGYHDITTRQAKDFYGAGSKGSWVWDNLRVRGTVFGYRHPYAHVAALSSGYTPKYAGNKKHVEQHRKILPSGHLPKGWLSGKGPYDPKWANAAAPHPDADQHPMTGASPHPHAQKHPMGDQTGKGGKYAERLADTTGESRRRHKEITARKVPLAIKSERAISDALGSHKAQHKAAGGEIGQAPGIPADKDEVPVKATAGEFVVRKEQAQKPEVKRLLNEVNNGTLGAASTAPGVSGQGSAAGSKVVDDEGMLKDVYHGGGATGQILKNGFDPNRQNVNAQYGPGFYFSESPEFAGSFMNGSGLTGGNQGTDPGVIKAKLDIKNPFDADKYFKNLITNPGISKLPYGMISDALKGNAAATAKLKELGFDGITHSDTFEGKKHKVWIAFHPEQVKDASRHKAMGGVVGEAPGIPADRDSVPVKATAGEYVVRKQEAQKPDVKRLLQELNAGLISPSKIAALLSGGADWLKKGAKKASLAASLWSAAAGGVPDAVQMAAAGADAVRPKNAMMDKTLSMYGKLRRREFEAGEPVPLRPQEHHADGGEVGQGQSAAPKAGRQGFAGILDYVLSEIKRGGGISGAAAAAAQGGGVGQVLGSAVAGQDNLLGSVGRAMSGTSPRAIADSAAAGQGAGLAEAANALKDAARQLSDAASQLNAPRPEASAAGNGAGTYGTYAKSDAGDGSGVYGLEAPRVNPSSANKLADVAGKKGALGGDAAAAGGAEAAGPLGAAGGPMGMAAIAAVGIVSSAFDKFVDLSKKFMDPAGSIRGAVAPFQSQVQAYNPATVQRFNLAMDNLSASVGRWFEPIILGATKFGDMLNVVNTAMGGEARDFVQAVIDPLADAAGPAAQAFLSFWREGMSVVTPMLQQLRPLGGIAGELFRAFGEAAHVGGEVYREWKPIIDILFPFGGAVDTVVSQLRLFAAGLNATIETLGEASRRLSHPVDSAIAELRGEIPNLGSYWTQAAERSMQRMQRPQQGPNGPMTVAAQQSRFVGIEEVGMNARQAAFSQGADRPPTAQQTDQIIRLLEQLRAAASAGNTAGAFALMVQLAAANQQNQ